MKKLFSILIMCTLVLGLFGCGNSKVKESTAAASNDKENLDITVSAAASLHEVLTEIQKKYEGKTEAKLSINFASSGSLQKQIEQGAPVDLFLSASKSKMDKLQEKDLIDVDTRVDLLKNSLVLIASKEYKDKIKQLSDIKNMDVKISIGEPESVPAGKYAKETMEHYKLWEPLKDKIVYGKTVKQVAQYVESGEAVAGIVYNTDVALLDKSYKIQTFDEKSHKPIVYPMAIVKNSKNKQGVKKFMKYLSSSEAHDMFVKFGFDPIKK
ncbi:molybdate ABC transporter substrate-binding protein [Clostridium ganghwense]|uniref:Molybdate ABC transporter substrate-binding protein n=1 Tax=Clostridium ganghwense TaxID=312089 RepID=A0ABT4CLY8_9CLOT|nr:molybdate ABC transporter substrate-binding protein [Clostridium ganghwense]MCY6369251.1 molybdate ABC transporter substrate-binding protein [Clostridium ganghwense]